MSRFTRDLQIKWRNFKFWFYYRLHPSHRYHILKLHDPGYRSIRHQMIHAVMGMVERHVKELRNHPLRGSGGKWTERAYLDAIELHIDFYRGFLDDPMERPLAESWIEHTEQLKDLWIWWQSVKDHPDLDCDIEYTNYDGEEITKDHPVWYEEVDRRLKQALDLRIGM